MVVGVILIVLFVLAGLMLSGSLFVQRRVLTWLAGGVGLAWGIFLGTTAIARALTLTPQSKLILFYMAAAVFLLLGLWLRDHFRRPTLNGWREMWVLLVLVPVLASVLAITSFNGHLRNGDWVLHSFYSGDVTTFVSLVQKSLLTPAWVTDNPFAAGLPLEYPTLLHAGVAEIVSSLGGGVEWIFFLPLMCLLTACLTVPLFFLYMDVAQPEPQTETAWFGVQRRGWVYAAQAVVVAYVLGMAWDNYVYPQSHFFLMGLFMVLVSLLVAALRSRGKLFKAQFFFASVLAVVLLLANAVTGAVAIALMIIFTGMRIWDEKISPKARGMYMLAAIIFVGVFLALSSGEAQFGWPHFSYGAAGDMMRFAPLLGLLTAAIFLYATEAFLAMSVALLTLFALFTFFFAGRGIIVDNASRFFYHAGLVGFPLIAPLGIRLYFWGRREIFYTTRTGVSRLMPVFLIAACAVLVALPPLSSIASTLDHLLFQDEHIISPAMREAGWWIADHTEPTDIVLASPTPPWAVPFLTGRSLVRAGEGDGSAYWLSANDELLKQQYAAFAGDKGAQQNVAAQADYLLLSGENRVMWEPVVYEKVFDTKQAVIYKLK